MLVFVYGTLKKGYHNHHLVKDCSFVGKATTNIAYRMFDAGFPVLMEDTEGDGHKVEGEVYDVPATVVAEALDRLEGKGRMYDRVRKYVTLNGRAERVYYYVGIPDFWDRQQGGYYSPTEGVLNWPLGKRRMAVG